MIFGIGTDIMEVSRVRESMQNNPGLRDEIFTPQEIDYCEARANKYQHYTARFAAKEALMKALGQGLQQGVRFNHIEVANHESGSPFILLNSRAKIIAEEKGILKILLSLAHVKEYATAMVVLEIA